MSSSFESGLGTSVLCELAAAYGGPHDAAGLDTYRLLTDDVLTARLSLGAAVALDRMKAEVDPSRLTELRHG